MARRSRSSATTSDIANELDSLLLQPMAMPALHPMSPFTDLTEIEDRREFHPEAANRPPLSFHHYTEFEVHEDSRSDTSHRPKRRAAARQLLQTRPVGRATQDRQKLAHEIGFRQPNRVAICVRRKQRREVLHALRKAGRGGRAHRRYNAYSQVRC